MRLLLLAFAVSLSAAPPEYTVKVIHAYPHDRTAFTQGFEYHDGKLYEGTGLEGRSTVRIDDLATGKVLEQTKLSGALFGEGITVIGGQIVELTWTTQIGFLYKQADLARSGEFHYEGEGWGLANDGKQIYFSDGTADIRVLNRTSLEEMRRIHVHQDDRPILMLNELEWVEGEIWANLWQTDRIARISPETGEVIGWIDASGLLSEGDRSGAPVDVLNGIAYDAEKKRIFLTGKLWPKIFEVEIVPK